MKEQIILFVSLISSFFAAEALAQDMVRVPVSGDSAVGHTACSIESISYVCDYPANGVQCDAETCEPAPCKTVNTCKASDLKPVTLKPFYIDAMPVTNALLQKCIADGKCTKPQNLEHIASFGADTSRPNVPAVVDYTLAEEYCASMGKSLPTEEQWLAAAMGDNVQKYAWGDDELLTATVQIPWYNFSNLVDAGSMPTDQINGIYDMTGNGYEWIKADIMRGYVPENAACIAEDSRSCMGAAPLPLYQLIGVYANTPATFRCVKEAE